MRCTCPDAIVTKGQDYLKTITPDSLTEYNLDYSEIYLEEVPERLMTPFLRGEFKISGKVVGKGRVDINSRWNPMVRIDSWD